MYKNKMIVLAALTAVHVASAETQLPYLGPENMDCKVNSPGAEFKMKDSGYFTSEDCKVIYVKPPAVGIIQTHGITYGGGILGCDGLDMYLQPIKNVLEENKKLRDPNQIKKAEKLYHDLIKSALNVVGRNTEAYAALSVSLDWNSLLKEYEKLNSDKHVRRLPVAAGVFSTKIKTQSNDLVEEEFNHSAVRRMEIHGIELTEDFDLTDTQMPEIFKKIKSDETSKNVLMGDALGASLELSLIGYCALKKENTNHQNNYLTGSYTYFYPVQTKASFGIKFNEDQLEKDILDVVRKKEGQVTDADFKEIDLGAIKIEINEGAVPTDGDGEKLQNKFESIIRKLALENILMSISSKVNVSVQEGSYIENEQRSTTSCHRRFLRSKHCHTTYYTVPVTKIDWNKVNEELRSLIKNFEAGVDSYKTIYMIGTSAVAPYSKE